MHVVVMTNDPVRLSFLQAIFADAGIPTFVLDHYTSGVEGSIGAIPRRLVVAQEDAVAAMRVLRDIGGADWS